MQMLEEDGTGSDDAHGRRLLQITRSEIARLERLVSDFLSYARPRPLELEAIPAVAVLERVADVLQGRSRSEGFAIVVEDSSDGATIEVDVAQIHQLLLNLADNAIEAIRDVGEPVLRLRAELRGHRVVLAVIDNGRGMSSEDVARASEVFYSKRKGGTGLGLAIVERIARGHDGSLAIASSPGEGTRVELSLERLSRQREAV